MTDSTQEFYDRFSSRFLRDYVRGNRRVDRQLEFLASSIPRRTRRILIIGAGSGESAFFVARHVAPRAFVLATDLSVENKKLGEALFSHPRIEYRQLDITQAGDLGEPFDVIILPDVYEHLPPEYRSGIHGHLKRLLGPRGLVLLTVPSTLKQEYVRKTGEGLQPIDEVVDVPDLLALAHDVQGTLTYLNLISVWDASDYLHAVIERLPSKLEALDPASLAPRECRDGSAFIGRARRLARRAYRWIRLKHRLRGRE